MQFEPLYKEQMMGFLKKLFGGGEEKPKEYVDKTGIYFYFQCDNCGARVKVRADKQHDLQNEGGGYVWHKTIVDSKCFRRMETVIHMDGNYNVTNYTLEGGKLLTEAAYEAAEKAEAEAETKTAVEAEEATAVKNGEEASDNQTNGE